VAEYVDLDSVDIERLRMTRTIQAGKDTAKEIGITYALFNRITCNYKSTMKSEQKEGILSFLSDFDERQPK
jgi:hypothetical protein